VSGFFEFTAGLYSSSRHQQRSQMERVKIKHSDWMELLKNRFGDMVFAEALKLGEIDVVDDVSGKVVDKISLENIDKKKGEQ
jgi:hypothetical protein